MSRQGFALTAALSIGVLAFAYAIADSHDSPWGTIFLTSQSIANPGTGCAAPAFKMGDGAAASSRANMPNSQVNSAGTACFEHNVTTPFTFGGPAYANLWIGCDPASVNARETGSSVSVELRKHMNKTHAGTSLSAVKSADASSALCQSSAPQSFNITLPTGNATFNVTERLVLKVQVFYSNPAASSKPIIYVAVGGSSTPSNLRALGLLDFSDGSVATSGSGTGSGTGTGGTATGTGPPTSDPNATTTGRAPTTNSTDDNETEGANATTRAAFAGNAGTTNRTNATNPGTGTYYREGKASAPAWFAAAAVVGAVVVFARRRTF